MGRCDEIKVSRNTLGWRHLAGIHILEKLAAQRLFGRAASAGVQVQHVVKQIQGRRRDAGRPHDRQRYYKVRLLGKSRVASTDLQSKLLSEPPPILLLWFHGVEERKLDHIWPHSGTRTAANTTETNTYPIFFPICNITETIP